MTQVRRGTVPTLDEVTTSSLSRYLSVRGWIRQQDLDGSDLIFQGPTDDAGDPIRIFLPTDENAYSRRSRLSDALAILSVVEKKDRDELLYRLLSQGVDAHEKRIQLRPGQPQRRISLALASDVVTHMRQMAAFAACVEEFPAPHFVRTSKVSSDFLENCYFPHTFAGSFGFAMEVGLPDSAQTSLHAPEEPFPFERRVMKRIALGLKSCELSFEKRDPGLLVDSYQSGMNSNMCGLLSSFTRKLKGREVLSTFSWSDEWSDPGLVDVQEIYISPEATPILDEASKALRAMKASVPVHIIATIQSIADGVHAGRYKESEFLNPDRTVVLMHEHEPAKFRSIRVSLDHDHHAEACDAFRDGFQVELKGELERIGKSLTLTSYSLFKVTPIRKSDVAEAIRARQQRTPPPDPPQLLS